MINLYIIDDHFLIIDGICHSFELVSDQFQVIGGTDTIKVAIAEISVNQPDIIVLDLFIYQTNPVTNFKVIHDTFPTVPIVILSQDNSLLWKLKMYSLGVKAFINKSESKLNLIQKLQRVASGEIVISDEVSKLLYLQNVEGDNLFLIPGFMEILLFLVNGKGPKEIAQKTNQSISTIEKKLQKIRNCFQVNTNCELIYKLTSGTFPFQLS